MRLKGQRQRDDTGIEVNSAETDSRGKLCAKIGAPCTGLTAGIDERDHDFSCRGKELTSCQVSPESSPFRVTDKRRCSIVVVVLLLWQMVCLSSTVRTVRRDKSKFLSNRGI